MESFIDDTLNERMKSVKSLNVISKTLKDESLSKREKAKIVKHEYDKLKKIDSTFKYKYHRHVPAMIDSTCMDGLLERPPKTSGFIKDCGMELYIGAWVCFSYVIYWPDNKVLIRTEYPHLTFEDIKGAGKSRVYVPALITDISKDDDRYRIVITVRFRDINNNLRTCDVGFYGKHQRDWIRYRHVLIMPCTKQQRDWIRYRHIRNRYSHNLRRWLDSIRYRPGGVGYKRARDSFEQNKKKMLKDA